MVISAAVWVVYVSGEIWQLLGNTGPVARIVLVTLLLASIFSWSITIQKTRTYKRARKQNKAFLQMFRNSRKLSDIRNSYHTFQESPLVGVFEGGYQEIENQAITVEGHDKPRIKSLSSIQRALQIAASGELTKLEKWMSWLATIGATTPFIGLFGTVWGIMGAFSSLSAGGSASIRSVAPGISEALIATAAGLFAAIPAVIAYNQFLQRLKTFGSQMDDFCLEFINMTERNFT